MSAAIHTDRTWFYVTDKGSFATSQALADVLKVERSVVLTARATKGFPERRDIYTEGDIYDYAHQVRLWMQERGLI